MPTLRQWEYVVAVSEHGSFSAAADKLRVSQPGLSQQVRVLERELGGPVFERLPRALLLTPLGRAILPRARSLVADAQRAVDAASSVASASAGSVDVVTLTSIGLGVLPGVLENWLNAHPGTSVNLIEHKSVDAVVAAMNDGAGDVAVSPMPRSWSGPHWLIGREEFVVVASIGHRLARRGPISLADLADESWVQFTPDHGLAAVLDGYAAAAGFAPRVAMRTPQTAAVPRFAAAGVGVALVPKNILDNGFTGKVLPLHDVPTRAVRAFTRFTPEALTSAFVDTVLSHANLAGTHNHHSSR